LPDVARLSVSLVGLSLLLLPAASHAQRLELGASIGLGTGGHTKTMTGVHASVWWNDRIDTGIRMAWWPGPYPHGSANYYVNCGDESPSTCAPVTVHLDSVTPRRFIAAEVRYHYRPGERLRPFAGAGYGRRDSSRDVSCAIPGCESLLSPTFTWGRRTSSAPDPIVMGGVSYAITTHLLARGVARLHLGGEELNMLETAVELGFRF